MQDPRSVDDAPLNAPEPEGEAKALQLAGREVPDEKDPVVDVADVDTEPDPTGQMLSEGDPGEVGPLSLVHDEDRLELLEDRELRSGETNDPELAAEEGLTYVPPTDPPVVPSTTDPEGAVVAAGFASSSLDTEYDVGQHQESLSAEDEMTDRVREAILADAATTQYAETIAIATEGGRVVLAGEVDDIEDADNLAAVAATVTGVAEVIDRTRVRGL